jgi:hypothetical protein
MFIVEALLAEDELNISVVKKNRTVALHFITNQGTVLLALTPEQADKLTEKLSEGVGRDAS